MKPLSIVSLFVLGTLSATASTLQDRSAHLVQHHRISRQLGSLTEPKVKLSKRSGTKKCKAKPKGSGLTASTPAGSNSGLINVVSKCGNIGATKKVTATSGPNGNIDWLNCGINSGGWNPPVLGVKDIVVVELSTAIQQSGSPFKPCEPYLDLFNKYAAQFKVPPILLASFAMQESTCNPSTVGGGGEQGLMQITQDKCGGAPGGNCRDPEFNIRTGAKFFADTLNGNNGDLLLTIGQYNGWQQHMTFGQATAAAHTSCCRCQNNLDYLHQFLNGWCQNVNAYGNNPRLGKYFNLDKCHD
ncbi:glycoside hydrolase family 23 protein [Rickenella mellea]|uniref:Glycoside hydrolase family 23 protein n=1 Tax=Rickenella mellea TaxID=50990 RepID=A0A4Y7QFV6_9AGAM|nr:glycoside hydrolase family 23 protein [Rickenella mellea]